jgi:hypothetical protein
VLLGCVASCGPTEELTQVLVIVDAQPGLRGEADELRVRVWDHEQAQVLDERRSIDVMPATVPLVPRGWDATRTFVLEATLLASGTEIAWGRAQGRYVAGEVREVLLCLGDSCRGEPCGSTEADCIDGTACATCVAPERACETAQVETLPRGAGLSACPAPSCVRTVEPGEPESACDDGIDDDCDNTVDCDDADCAGRVCGPRGETCSDGACDCPTAEDTPALCSDGVSNDCDDDVDCRDADCAGVVCDAGTGMVCNAGTGLCMACPGLGDEQGALCGNGVDDDCDGLVDCDDPQCCPRTVCAGRTCGGSELKRCCMDACVSIDRSPHCGGCRGDCVERASGVEFECVQIETAPADGPPRFACRCYDLGSTLKCPAGMVCAQRREQTLCQCTDDVQCGYSDAVTCQRTGIDEHNYCVP